MKLARIYFMLLVTVITFIGLPTANLYLSLISDFGIENFALDFSEEEERESSKNETKEFETKQISHQKELDVEKCNLLNSVAFQDHLSSYSSLIKEVTTPPPEEVFV